MKKYIFITLIIIIIAGVWFSLSYQPEDESANINNSNNVIDNKNGADKAGNDGSEPQDQFKDIDLDLYNKTRTVSWQLEATEVSSFSGKGLLKLNPVIIKAYNQQDEYLYSLSAEKGDYLSEDNRLDLIDSITLKKEELELLADKLIWQGKDDLITGAGSIRIKTPRYLLTGDHFETDSALNRITIYGNQKEQASFIWTP